MDRNSGFVGVLTGGRKRGFTITDSILKISENNGNFGIRTLGIHSDLI